MPPGNLWITRGLMGIDDLEIATGFRLAASISCCRATSSGLDEIVQRSRDRRRSPGRPRVPVTSTGHGLPLDVLLGVASSVWVQSSSDLEIATGFRLAASISCCRATTSGLGETVQRSRDRRRPLDLPRDPPPVVGAVRALRRLHLLPGDRASHNPDRAAAHAVRPLAGVVVLGARTRDRLVFRPANRTHWARPRGTPRVMRHPRYRPETPPLFAPLGEKWRGLVPAEAQRPNSPPKSPASRRALTTERNRAASAPSTRRWS